MDKKTLVTALTEFFKNEKTRSGLAVDAFMLVPAYVGYVANVYVLAISAPSWIGREEFDKLELLINLFHKHVSVEVRQHIDRFRVYDSVEAMTSDPDNHFQNPDYVEALRRRGELVEVG